jgi:hypothetical protein
MEIARWIKSQLDRVLAIVACIAGLVLVGIGWAGVSRSTLVTQQIPYLASGGLFGIFLLGISATLWLSADLRDEWRKLEDIHRSLDSEPLSTAPTTTVGEERRSSQAAPKARSTRDAIASERAARSNPR